MYVLFSALLDIGEARDLLVVGGLSARHVLMTHGLLFLLGAAVGFLGRWFHFYLSILIIFENKDEPLKL